MLSETIDKSESGLSGKQADRLKQIFHELAHGAQIGETPEAAPASPAGDKLAETVSAILGDTGLGAGDKIREIMAAVENLVGEVLAEGGSRLDDAQIAGIKEMMGKITENIETLALEELTDFDITDEIISTDEEMQEEQADDEALVETVVTADEETQTEFVHDADGLSTDETEIAADEIIEEISLPEDGLEAGFEAEEGSEDEIDTAVEEVLEEVALPPAEGGPLDSTQLADGPDISVTTSDSDIDGQLREKTELLTRLAQAAQELASLGPDLTGSVYTEEEIREKAQFLSEEFNRYLSLRDKFYNAHVLIKGGNYLVGGAHLTKSELAEQIAVLPDFYIGKFPVTNAIFEIFIEQTGYITTAERYGYSIVYFPRMQHSRDPVTGVERFSLHKSAYSRKVTGACWHRPLGPESSLHLKRTHPVVHVSLEDARAFASWTGKRLPTEIEWEAAARTAQAYIFPWGNQWRENACNTEAGLHGDTTPVDHYIKFANQAGVADTLGNILEWTGDVLGDNTETDMCITKGASWIARGEISLTDRHYVEKDTSSNILGFRCVAI
jgi:formylglycine-generating enzyme required for sulfatase activity